MIAVLLCWNIALTVMVTRKDETKQTGTDPVVVEQVIRGYTTDLTTIVEKSESKVVQVKSFREGTLWQSASGTIIGCEDGVVSIVSNHHVIEDSATIHVIFDSGEEFTAELVGTDPYTDVCLMKVNTGFDVTPFEFGDSSRVKKGEYCLSMGSPLGDTFKGSVTFGIISGKDRVIAVDIDHDGLDDWDVVTLQSSAALSPGCSGGPLINMAGDLIGINTYKVSSYEADGINLAIPSDELKVIVETLEEDGSVVRPNLGLSVDDISTMTVYRKTYLGLNLEQLDGVLVSRVSANSAAGRAGIIEGDIIISINDKSIETMRDYRNALYRIKAGDELQFTVIRNGAEVNVSVIAE